MNDSGFLVTIPLNCSQLRQEVADSKNEFGHSKEERERVSTSDSRENYLFAFLSMTVRWSVAGLYTLWHGKEEA
jgi:hypothetical protein